MSVDAHKVAAKLKGESAKARVNLYLDKKTYDAFQVACKKLEISASKAMDVMMTEFIASADPKKK